MSDPLAEHVDEVVSKTWNFSGRLEDERDHTLNAVMGLAAEAGEVLDLHKKVYFHRAKDEKGQMEWENDLLLELGDVCYYLAKVLDLYGWSLDMVLAANKAKLFARHHIGG